MSDDPKRGPSVSLAKLARGTSSELRISWDCYDGKTYLAIRQWNLSVDGKWLPDGKRGISVKRRELEQVRDALSRALDLAGSE